MVAKHAPDDFAEMLKRYDRAMNRLVNGDPEPIKALYSHSDETSQCGAWVVSTADGPKSMPAGTGLPHNSSPPRTRSSRNSC